jgi:hypothetical protein
LNRSTEPLPSLKDKNTTNEAALPQKRHLRRCAASLRHCGVATSTPHSERLARLASGAFAKALSEFLPGRSLKQRGLEKLLIHGGIEVQDAYIKMLQ